MNHPVVAAKRLPLLLPVLALTALLPGCGLVNPDAVCDNDHKWSFVAGCVSCGPPGCNEYLRGSPGRQAEVAPVSAPGATGGTVSTINPVSAAGCSGFAPGLSAAPDAVWARTAGGVAIATGYSTVNASAWAPVQPADLGLTGSSVYTTACSGSTLLVGTDKGLEWISLLDRSTGLFTAPPSFGNGVNSILVLPGGKALAGVVGDGSVPSVLLCDVSSKTCGASASGIPVNSATPLLFQAPGNSGAPIVVGLPGVGGSSGAAVYRSADGGATWTPASGLPAGTVFPKAFAATSSRTFLATTAGLLRSTDGGGTWSAVTISGLPSGGVSALAASGNTLYTSSATSLPLVYRSADGGSSWTSSSLGPDLTQVHGLAATQSAVWAATNRGVFRSADGGATWQPYNAGLSNLNIARLAAAPGSGASVYAATSSDTGGPIGQSSALFLSGDHGGSWAPSANVSLSGAVLYDLVVTSAGTALATDKTASGLLFRSTDGGVTWTFPSVPAVLTSLATSGATSFAIAVSPSRAVYKSVDEGRTWASAGAAFGALFSSVFPGSFAANGSALAVAFGSAVARSADGGATWQAGPNIPASTSVSIQRLSFAGSMLWAADGTAGLWKSSDTGATWAGPVGGIPPTALVSDVLAAGSQLLAATSLGVYVSLDGGTTWNPLRGDLVDIPATALAVSGPNLVIGTKGRSILTVPLAAVARRLIPIVLDVNGLAHYTTELSLANRGTSDAPITLLYTASLGSGTGTVSDVVRAGSQMHIPDVLAYLRVKGLAIPSDGSEAGTLLLTFSGLSDPTAAGAVARTTASTGPPQPVGAAGLAYMGVDPAEGVTGSLIVYGLRSSATDRSNLAVYNMSSDPVTYRVTLFAGDGSGANTVVAAADSLPAWGWRQYNRVLDGPGYGNGWAVVTRASTTGALGGYGVINDNITSDGSFVTPAPSGARLLYLNLPVLVETSAFLSELILTNASSSPGTFALAYTEGLSPSSGGGGSADVSIPAHTQRIIPNAIAYLRSLGIPAGAPGGNYAGSLNVEVTGGAPGEIYAGARTASQSPAGGQFGLFTPAVFPGDEGVSVAYLYGLRADANNRSNVAAVNTATDPKAGNIALLLEAFDGDAAGALKGSTTLTLAPGQWAQVGGFLGSSGVANGWVRVTRTSGTAPWIAYGVVNDGGAPGQRTGDGAYVPMELP
ncbi:MAG: WD40/YVTN/BNR-like repeat-containing protein [Thermoanaerobaculia bacterium]